MGVDIEPGQTKTYPVTHEVSDPCCYKPRDVIFTAANTFSAASLEFWAVGQTVKITDKGSAPATASCVAAGVYTVKTVSQASTPVIVLEGGTAIATSNTVGQEANNDCAIAVPRPCTPQFPDPAGYTRGFSEGFGCHSTQCTTLVTVTEADACSASTGNPCQNNGICIDEVADYRCECVNGFQGRNCEFPCEYWSHKDRLNDRVTYCDQAGYDFTLRVQMCTDVIAANSLCGQTEASTRCLAVVQNYYKRCAYCTAWATSSYGMKLTYYGPDFTPVYDS
eukprot:COSAG01_NODE_18985_length_1039_cov_1.055319_1_plen_278_part_01